MNKRWIFWIWICLFAGTLAQAQQVAIDEWTAYLPYRNVSQVIDGGDVVYALGTVYYYSYDKQTGEINRYDKVWGLSDVQVSNIAYNADLDALVVVYENTNIDVVKNGTEVINLSDIQRKSIGGDKRINNVYFNDSLAYISTSFGIVVLDVRNMEFADTYVIGDNGDQVNVQQVVVSNNYIYAATDEGVKRAQMTGTILANFQNWTLQTEAMGLPEQTTTHIVSYNDSVFTVINDTLFRFNAGSWSKVFYNDTVTISAINGNGNNLLLALQDTAAILKGRVLVLNSAMEASIVDAPSIVQPLDVLTDPEGNIWVADLIQGLHRFTNGTLETIVMPDGPLSNNVSRLSIRDGNVWVAPGGVNEDYANVGNADGFFVNEGGFWRNENQFNNSGLEGVLNIFSMYAVPNSNVTWMGTFWDGLLRYQDGKVTKYNQDNSTLEGQIGDEARTKIGGITQDSEGNIWVTNSGTNTPIQAIKPDGTFIPFAIPNGGNVVADIILDDAENKWAIVPGGGGIIVLNYGADIDDPTDDIYKLLGSGAGNGGLHNTSVRSIAIDNDGEIWVGTTEGISVFYCASAVLSESGCDAQRILVERDGFAGFLLEQERVNAIAVDGGNRKWVGTSNGLWLFSPDGLEELAYYTEENSPLMSNNIRTIAIDGASGMVYVGTDKGLMSIRGEATEGTEEHDDKLVVFPNPVREDYTGPIAIKGLATNSEVKITDAGGTLIYETQAFGGQAIWDGRDYNGRKAKTGVYLIFSMNADGTDSKTGKLLLIK